jgi:hypothetical protein
VPIDASRLAPSRRIKRAKAAASSATDEEKGRRCALERQNTSVIELPRRFTRLALQAMQLQERPDAALIIREGGTERVRMLL